MRIERSSLVIPPKLCVYQRSKTNREAAGAYVHPTTNYFPEKSNSLKIARVLFILSGHVLFLLNKIHLRCVMCSLLCDIFVQWRKNKSNWRSMTGLDPVTGATRSRHWNSWFYSCVHASTRFNDALLWFLSCGGVNYSVNLFDNLVVCNIYTCIQCLLFVLFVICWVVSLVPLLCECKHCRVCRF